MNVTIIVYGHIAFLFYKATSGIWKIQRNIGLRDTRTMWKSQLVCVNLLYDFHIIVLINK